MGKRKLIQNLLLFLFFPTILSGQIKNKLDLDIKAKVNLRSDSFASEYLKMDYGYNGYPTPTVLGNVTVGPSFDAALLYSGLSFYFQPSLYIGYTNYEANYDLKQYFHNLKFRSYSVGIGCRVNFVNYSRNIIVPYLVLDAGLRLNKISNDTTSTLITLKNDYGSAYYMFYLLKPTNSTISFNPYFETVLGIETKFTTKLCLLTEIDIVFVNYPVFDVPHPTLSKEMYLSFGFGYKFIKNKKYYYD